MGWKILEIENAYKLSLFLDNIVIYSNDSEKITIPINDIDVLLINNYKLNLSIQLINHLTEKNVVVIICDNNYLPSSLIIPLIGNFNTIKILNEQINWNHKWKSKLWQQIIKIKISNQKYLVNKMKINKNLEDNLNLLIKEVREYNITNREGHASKIYWHGLFGIDFKRFDDDYVNKLLNYGYTILRAYFTRSIIKKGLDPRISIFHKSFHNYFALSSDLMEVFRVMIDAIIYKIYIVGEINFYEHKTIILESFNKKILVNGKKYFVNKAIDLFIDSIVSQTELPILEFDEFF